MTKALRLRGIMPLELGKPDMSNWQDARRKEISSRSRASPRHCRAFFPSAVLSRALGRPFVPPTPRLAIDSYWRAHPIRADRLARALAARSGAPSGWTWRLADNRKDRIAGHIPNAARTLSRTRIRAGSRILLCMRAAGLSLRLACRSVERRRQQECDLALRLRGRMAILECAERPGPSPAAPASAALRSNRRAAVEDRRG